MNSRIEQKLEINKDDYLDLLKWLKKNNAITKMIILFISYKNVAFNSSVDSNEDNFFFLKLL